MALNTHTQQGRPRVNGAALESPPMTGLKVMKFGGTSVGSPERLKTVAELVARTEAEGYRVVCVVSAASGVTDRLAASLADAGSSGTLDYLRDRYTTLAGAVLPPEALSAYLTDLEETLAPVASVYALRALLGACPDQEGVVLACGERLMAPLVAALLRDRGIPARPVDAGDLFETNDQYTEAAVRLDPTVRRITAWFARWPERVVPVVTGWVGSTRNGRTSVLGRGGSDYTAAVLARALGADVMERWTDTDGIYTADPNIDPSARHVPTIPYHEALPFNRAGRLGMHHRALDPLRATRIPVHVRSTFAPDGPGTFILPAMVSDD